MPGPGAPTGLSFFQNILLVTGEFCLAGMIVAAGYGINNLYDHFNKTGTERAMPSQSGTTFKGSPPSGGTVKPVTNLQP